MPLTQKEVMLARAREQRRNNVNAEAMIWRAVRSRRSEGFKFRRQVPIENFILDFVCFETRCVVEIDGPSHKDRPGKTPDETPGWRLRAFVFCELATILLLALQTLPLGRCSHS